MSQLQIPKKRTGQTSVSVEDSAMKARNFVGTPIDTEAANAHQQRRSVSSPISPVAVVSFMTTTDGETPQTTPVRIEYSVDQIDTMQYEIAAARDANEFPGNTRSYVRFQFLVEDYQRLQHLQSLRRGLSPQEASQEWRTAFVDTARELADRDAANAEQDRNARIENNVHSIIERENQAADSYNMRLHTAVHAVRLATGNAQANGVSMPAILNEIRTIVENMASHGSHGVQGVDMEAVCEEIFGIVESSLLDATGPLRLNNSRFGTQIENMTTQVGAMNNHVSAVGNHVSALGALIHAVNTTSLSTNTQMGEVSTQLHTVQDIAHMIPDMIQEAIQRILPDVIQASMIPALIGAIQTGAKGAVGKDASFPSVYTKEKIGDGNPPRKTKKSCFLSRLFGSPKMGGRKDGNGSSTGMAC